MVFIHHRLLQRVTFVFSHLVSSKKNVDDALAGLSHSVSTAELIRVLVQPRNQDLTASSRVNVTRHIDQMTSFGFLSKCLAYLAVQSGFPLTKSFGSEADF